ncbi:MAG: hypothetical protein IPN16_20950 [Gemmatimonadetes bacterium]|nr:hypothetical protein [Gemmatimonadota bacterium]
MVSQSDVVRHCCVPAESEDRGTPRMSDPIRRLSVLSNPTGDNMTARRKAAAKKRVTTTRAVTKPAGKKPVTKRPSARKPAAKKPLAKKGHAARTLAVPTAGDDWSRLATRLASALDALAEDHYLVLSVVGRHRFVQFAQQGKWGIRAECVSNAYLPRRERLSKSDERALSGLGWAPPNLVQIGSKVRGDDPHGSPNWYIDFARPIDYSALVDLTVRTFRDVYDVRHPSTLRYKAFESAGARILLPELLVAPEPEDALAPPAAPMPLIQRVAMAAEYEADNDVTPLGPAQFGVDVDGIPLTVVLEEQRLLARIISPLFPADVFKGDLPAAINQMNAEHIAFGYTYVRDGEVRYAAEVLVDPFHPDVIPVALKIAASVVWGLRREGVGWRGVDGYGRFRPRSSNRDP